MTQPLHKQVEVTKDSHFREVESLFKHTLFRLTINALIRLVEADATVNFLEDNIRILGPNALRVIIGDVPLTRRDHLISNLKRQIGKNRTIGVQNVKKTIRTPPKVRDNFATNFEFLGKLEYRYKFWGNALRSLMVR